MNKKSSLNRYATCLLMLFLLSFISCNRQARLLKANELTLSEGFVNPLGFYDAEPTFSWKLPALERNKSQSAYQIVVATRKDLLPENADLWNSKKQKYSQSVWVKYEGQSLQSRQKVYWQVKYWNQDGKASEWSD